MPVLLKKKTPSDCVPEILLVLSDRRQTISGPIDRLLYFSIKTRRIHYFSKSTDTPRDPSRFFTFLRACFRERLNVVLLTVFSAIDLSWFFCEFILPLPHVVCDRNEKNFVLASNRRSPDKMYADGSVRWLKHTSDVRPSVFNRSDGQGSSARRVMYLSSGDQSKTIDQPSDVSVAWLVRSVRSVRLVDDKANELCQSALACVQLPRWCTRRSCTYTCYWFNALTRHIVFAACVHGSTRLFDFNTIVLWLEIWDSLVKTFWQSYEQNLVNL